jgi:putative Mn2+ efflux pump MntP
MVAMLPIVAFAAPLGTDSAAVCTAYAARQHVVWRRRFLIAATLTAFEAGMPGVGMALSGPAASVLGEWSHWLAGGLLAVLGVWMLTHDDDGDGPELGAAALLAVAVAVSVDEVAVGVSLGLAGVPLVPLAATIAVWVFAATMAGLTFGSRLAGRFAERAGTAAAVALIGLGILVGTGVL